MKRIIVLCLCMMLVITIIPFAASKKNEKIFEKNDLKFDVFHSIRFVRKNGLIKTAIFQSWNPLWQIFLKHLDIVSFSIYEDSNYPEFLYAKMKIRDFQYSERRASYAIYWMYDDTRYYVCTNTHTNGECVGLIAGYFGEDGPDYSTPVNGGINEEESILTWVIPKNIIGNPEAGDQLVEIHANTYLIYQKDCEARIKLFLANDWINPSINECWSYVIQL